MFCSECGRANKDGAKFCIGCGADLAAQTPPPGSSSSATPYSTLSGSQTIAGQTPRLSTPSGTLSGEQTVAPGTPAWNMDAGGVSMTGLALKTGDLVAGRFEILAELGAGGMGKVFRVRDTRLGVERALKVIVPQLTGRPDVLERFRDEVITSQKLSHPNIVRVHEYDEDKERGLHFFTMEYIEGRPLRRWLQDRLQKKAPVTWEEFGKLAGMLCDALGYAHGITIHRDLKPDNVLVSEDLSSVKLVDFGIAKALRGTALHLTAGALGTPHYMAPEQESGETVDQRADIYSLGVMFYELLTGRIPRVGSRPLNALRPDIPPWVGAAIARAMADDPDRRFKTAQELRAVLLGEAAVDGY